MRVCFLYSGRFSLLGMTLQSLPPSLCLGGPPSGLTHLYVVVVPGHKVGGAPELA